MESESTHAVRRPAASPASAARSSVARLRQYDESLLVDCHPMIVAAKLLLFFIALLHVYILVLEMFLWRTRARRIFGMSAEQAETTATLAKNQGLYNGFLAAGLFWAESSRTDFAARAYFFLACVLIAGVYGSLTANRRILYIQALPAAAALAAVWLS